MNLFSAPFWLRAIYPKGLIWSIATEQKEVYLTFDDGPIPEVTPIVIDILRMYNIKATFFCVGNNVQKYPEIFDLLQKEGHSIGNHTFHHLKSWETDITTFLSDVDECQKLVKSKLFRPPHGQLTRKLAKQLIKDYQLIMWTVLTGDYDNKLSGDECLKKAVKHTKPGSIVVFHDSIKARERMEYALPRYIEYCLANGYLFKAL